MIETNNGNKFAFDAIKIGMASPEQIREWSYGEVKKPETINYRTLKPEKDGLYCERIFGLPRTGSATAASTRRSATRVRSATAAASRSPVPRCAGSVWATSSWPPPFPTSGISRAHPREWALSLISPPRELEKVLYFAKHIVIDPGDTPLEKGQTLDEKDYDEYRLKYDDAFKAGMGAEAIKELLSEIGVSDGRIQAFSAVWTAFYDSVKQEWLTDGFEEAELLYTKI